jgi:hypothetical protein
LDSCSRLCSDAPQTPTHVHTQTLLGLLPMTPLGAPCLSALQILGTPLGRPLRHPCLNSSYKSEPVPSDPVQTSILIRIILVSTSPNPCHPIPLFKPAPSDPVWTSVHVCVTIRTLAIQLHSDIRVSLRLTSSSPCLWGPLGPLSLSTLRVLCGSKPLVTAGTVLFRSLYYGLSSRYYYSWINNGGNISANVNFIIGQKFLENYHSMCATTNSCIGFTTRTCVTLICQWGKSLRVQFPREL